MIKVEHGVNGRVYHHIGDEFTGMTLAADREMDRNEIRQRLIETCTTLDYPGFADDLDYGITMAGAIRCLREEFGYDIKPELKNVPVRDIMRV